MRSGGRTGKQSATRILSIDTHAYYGVGASLTLPQLLAARQLRHPSVVIDEALMSQPAIQGLLHSWQEQGMRLSTCYPSRTTQEPDYDYLDQATEVFRSLDTDAVIGIGGGSAMDLAKGVALLLRNPGPGITYRGMNLVQNPGLPVVLIPTTAGSGSEVTQTASFIDPATKTKLGINGRYVGAAFSVLDPALLSSCPASVTVGSGLDALVHAIEAVTTKQAHTVSVLFGVEAVRLLLASLPAAVAHPDDLDARADMLLGSHYAGIAMCNAGGGPASGISYPLGVHYRVPHGMAGGLLLPHVISFNIAQGHYAGYARIYERLQVSNAASHRSDRAMAHVFEQVFWDLYHRLGAPKTFEQWGVGRGAVALLTDLTMAQRKANLDANPVPFKRKHVIALLQAVTR